MYIIIINFKKYFYIKKFPKIIIELQCKNRLSSIFSSFAKSLRVPFKLEQRPKDKCCVIMIGYEM